jgi:hypothetical protein
MSTIPGNHPDTPQTPFAPLRHRRAVGPLMKRTATPSGGR